MFALFFFLEDVFQPDLLASVLLLDGGGLGACVLTGSEHLGIPGRYERHYTKDAIRSIFERAGWHVVQCRDNYASETGEGTEGHYVYVEARAIG